MKRLVHYLAITTLLLAANATQAGTAPKIDPIRFELKTDASQVSVNEEFEITITAQLMNIPANTVYVFENSNSFRLKLIAPQGFQQTGGTFSDLIGAELTSSNRTVTYTVRGKFTTSGPEGSFALLRGHKSATNQSNFVEVDRLTFNVDEGESEPAARINLATAASYVKYLTIAQLRAGSADTTSVVFITDNLKQGTFKHNPSATGADDGAMTIIAPGGRRYERVYDGVVNVNWFGIVADGVTDQTALWQSLLNNSKYPKLYFPSSASSYRIRAIRILSNKSLEFGDNVVVEGMGTLGITEPMVYMIAVSNISIKGNNVTFKDHREKYTSGQQRHVIIMQGVKNVTIEGISANDGGGDGFYIGATSAIMFSENVTLLNVKADNNRRQGLSIISGKNILVQNGTFTNSKGEGPCAGIDIEPNTPNHYLEKIRIINPVTRNNQGVGILIAPAPLSGTDRVVDITIENHYDYGSHYGLGTASVTAPLAGTVIIKNPVWDNSRWNAFNARNWSSRGPIVQVINPIAINPNTTGSTSPNLGAAFLIYKAVGDPGDPNIGNIHIFSPTIQDSRPTQKFTSSFCYRDLNGSGARIYNCSITDPVLAASAPPNRHLIVHNAEVAISDKLGYFSTDIGNFTRFAGYTYYGYLYHNQTSTAVRFLKLEKVNPNFPEVIVEVRSPYQVRILPASTDNILPLSPVNFKYIASNVVGSRIVLRKTTDNSWHVVSMVGTWTVEP
ncbi:right-handed parallel beta-helix repeat-containing protein [Dyadobacter fermentans]|uniref:Parallel beta-helix repeat protein n=1 Tax=Dyadobacter fermentans (strain ATCC 700827 / DSM 18053 / CIP 107007 / KCTC 52180 / NS114) TaxID=471854 RepID=C6W3U4_DYAFD|nr:right-handed parallel beta-helix repeat-containing protein [Dyadobacter fermentans]ACT95792.1 Parallel beta-helix repeat protein [Dyadobacter fermentans DSM 18053]